MSKRQPIRVFWSILGQRFYASRNYRVEGSDTKYERICVMGEKFDVTDDIARAILQHDIVFSKVTKEEKPGRKGDSR